MKLQTRRICEVNVSKFTRKITYCEESDVRSVSGLFSSFVVLMVQPIPFPNPEAHPKHISQLSTLAHNKIHIADGVLADQPVPKEGGSLM